MSVKVKISGSNSATHDKGQFVVVKEGHLFVYDGAFNTSTLIAVYAPNHWLSAVADENVGASA